MKTQFWFVDVDHRYVSLHSYKLNVDIPLDRLPVLVNPLHNDFTFIGLF